MPPKPTYDANAEKLSVMQNKGAMVKRAMDVEDKIGMKMKRGLVSRLEEVLDVWALIEDR